MLARQRSVDSPAGTEFLYNNGAYNLVGSIVKPLGMTRTLIRDSPELVIPNRADGYTWDERGLHAASQAVGVVGNDGLYTTPEDLLRWERNFEDPRVGTPQTLASMQKPAMLNNGKPTQYGLGLFLMNYRGLPTVEHGGDDRGIEAKLIRFPQQKLAIALLCNSDAIDATALTQNIADIYLERTPGLEPRAAVNAPATTVSLTYSELKARAGVYRNPSEEGLRDITISVRGAKLIGHTYYSGDSDFDLIPIDRAHLRLPGGTIEFIPGHGAHQQSLKVQGGDGWLDAVLELVTTNPHTAELASFTGEYWSGELEADFGIMLKGSGLALRQPGMTQISLVPFGKDAFTGPGIVKFFRNARGGVAGFTISRYNARNVRFNRMRPLE